MVWITIAEAAKIAKLSKRMVYAAAERKELRVAKIGAGRNMRTTEAWTHDWLLGCATGGRETSDGADAVTTDLRKSA